MIERGHEIKVLDHGYVKLVDFMGSDESIVEDARMSTGRGFVSWEPYRRCKNCDRIDSYSLVGACACGVTSYDLFPRGDLGILTTLHANRHTTPFETGGELKIEVQAPIMVFREWHRHRTQSYNEFSARYAQMPNLHYVPEAARIQKQSTTNKQGSAEPFDERFASVVTRRLQKEQQDTYAHYEELCGDGVAKEVARLNTPVSRYSKMRAKTDLHNWLGFLRLRHHPSAQWEIQQYAVAVAEIVKELWPRTWALFEEHDLGGVRLSRSEVQALRALIGGERGAATGLNERQVGQLLGKLGAAS